MMFNRFYNMEMKNTSASAPSANAGSSYALPLALLILPILL